jgi:hypothetical protein
MFSVLTILWIARRGSLHERWLGYRSLAEAFRSSIFLAMINAPIRDEPGDRSLSRGRSWFQRAFSATWDLRPIHDAQESLCDDLRHFLLEGWLNDQIRYHKANAERQRRTRIWLTRAILVLFGVTFVVGIIHALDLIGGSLWPKVFVFMAVAMPGFGAALSGIRDQHNYRTHQRRSERTARRLEALSAQMRSHTNMRSMQHAAMQVQNAIEAENLDWSGVVEFQDLEMIV